MYDYTSCYLGLVRSIGVSNFTIEHLLELMDFAEIKPTVNQVA